MTLENGRASKAYNFVYEAKNSLTAEEQDKYKSYVKKLPMLIKVNGLGPAMAFVNSKSSKKSKEKENKENTYSKIEKENKENAYSKIYKQIDEWLIEKNLVKNDGELIEEIIQKNSYEYRIITNEVLELLGWMKRFVETMIEGDNK